MVSKAKLVLFGLGLLLILVGIVTAVGGYLEWRREVAESRQKLQQPITAISTEAGALLAFETKARSGSFDATLGRGEAQLGRLAATAKDVNAATLPSAEKTALKAYIGELSKLAAAETAKYRKLKATAGALDGAKDVAVSLSDPATTKRDAVRATFRAKLAEASAALDGMEAADKAFYKQVVASRDALEQSRPALTGYTLLDDKVVLDVLAAHQTK